MSEKGLTPAERKEQTTKRVNDKIAALRQALKNRSRDRFSGLPKTITAFLEWSGEGEKPLHEINRQTLNSREDLKLEVQKVLKERKDTPEEDIAKQEARIKLLEQQVKGLASANHEMHLEVDRLKRELSLRDTKIEKLELNRGNACSSNVSSISDKRR